MIDAVLTARATDLGGFFVGRVLPADRPRSVGPFVFLDHFGPAVLPPGQGVDSRPHPHIGLCTLTYLLAGEVVHKDSLGFVETVRPGAAAFMNAGRGIVHSERSGKEARAAGGPMHGLQAWVALPAEREDDAPSFAHHPASALPTFDEGGAWARLVAGTAFGEAAPTPVCSPLFYLHFELRKGARATLPAEHAQRAVYVARGHVEIGGRRFSPEQLVIIGAGASPVIAADGAATVVALGGAPVGERLLWWNLVSSTRERIERAKADWAAGRMALPPGDDEEWIPLPEDDRPLVRV